MALEYQKQKKGRKKKRISKARRRRRKVLAGLFLACVCIILGIVYGVMYHYVGKFPEDKICNNIFIGDADVSGLTQEEAMKEMQQHLLADQAKVVTMKVGDETAAAILEELGLGYQNMEKTIKKAVDYGKKGGLWKRYWNLKNLSKEKLVLTENFVLDEEQSNAIISERAVPLANHAMDAAIEKSGNGFRITKEQEGETVDIESSISELENVLNHEWKHEDLAVELILEKESPKITEADLSSIQDELGTFSTDAGGGDRWQNLKTGVELLNGSVLMPGEEMSVHDKTAPYDEEHGYVEAGAYENGQVVSSVGGGICQVSSTLYNAVLFAELEVLERYPHSMLVSYVSPSRDAAIAASVIPSYSF